MTPSVDRESPSGKQNHLPATNLYEGEARFRLVAESMPQKVFTARPNGEVDYFNPQWSEFTGLAFDEIRDWGWTQFIHPDDVEENVRRWQHSIDTGQPFELEHRFRRSDGIYRWHLSRARAVRAEDGTVLLWVGSNTDIDDQKRSEEEIARRAGLAALAAEVGTILTEGGPLRRVLQRCSSAVVAHLDAAFARVWTLEDGQILVLQSSAGMYTHMDGAHSRVPLGEFKIGRIAQTGKPHLTNEVAGDSEVHDQAWAEREGMIAFAGYPLVIDERVIGVMALFARHALTDYTLEALASVADSIALGIERQRVEAERDRARIEAEAQRARLHALFMQAPALILMLSGPEHIVELANPPYLQTIGNRNAVGRTIRECLPELAGQGFFELLDTVFATGEPFVGSEMPVSLDHDSGGSEQAYFNFVYQPLRSIDGDIEGILVLAVDVTAQVLARRQRDDFLSAIAHDLKNPITVLQGQAQLLQRRVRRAPIDQEQIVSGLALIEERARMMSSLIDELLDVNLLRMGQQLQLNRELVNLADLVQRCLDTVRVAGAGHHLVLTGTQTEIRGWWDAVRLTRVLTNLLENAVKYSRDESEVRVTLAQEEQDGRPWAVLSVQDNGLGIPAADLPHIFDWFYRAENVPGTVAGTGIGLAGARQIVEQLGGTINCVSREGAGSTFTVRLPLEPPIGMAAE